MKIYTEPMAKVMFLNVNSAICTTEIIEESEVITPTTEPMF